MPEDNQPKQENRFDDGKWHAATMGHFIGLLVDAGQDPAVMFRVIRDSPVDANGVFTREMEIILIPDGQVAATLNFMMDTNGPIAVQNTLDKLIEKGLVK